MKKLTKVLALGFIALALVTINNEDLKGQYQVNKCDKMVASLTGVSDYGSSIEDNKCVLDLEVSGLENYESVKAQAYSLSERSSGFIIIQSIEQLNN